MNNLTVGMCSWRNPRLLKNCIASLMDANQSKNNIKVVLNEADDESIEFLKFEKIDFVALSQNRGVLAIDYLKPLIDTEYFMSTNDDMIFAEGFQSDLESIMKEYGPASASCSLVEPFWTQNNSVVVDSLGSAEESSTTESFVRNIRDGKYKISRRVSYNHPIMVRTEDFYKVGGYSANFDNDFVVGYGADDYFAYRLWKLHKENFLCVSSNKSFVYHGVSQTMKKIDQKVRDANSGQEAFLRKTGMSIQQFRTRINCGREI